MKLLHRLPGALLASIAITIGAVLVAHQFTPLHAKEAHIESDEHQGLTLEITDIQPGEGQVWVMIFDDKAAWKRFDTEQLAAYREFDATQQQVEIQFESLTNGPYAIALWHDEDGERDFDISGGYPMEGYGTSGARDAYDEVPFSRAAMAPGRVRVKMYYPDW